MDKYTGEYPDNSDAVSAENELEDVTRLSRREIAELKARKGLKIALASTMLGGQIAPVFLQANETSKIIDVTAPV